MVRRSFYWLLLQQSKPALQLTTITKALAKSVKVLWGWHTVLSSDSGVHQLQQHRTRAQEASSSHVLQIIICNLGQKHTVNGCGCLPVQPRIKFCLSRSEIIFEYSMVFCRCCMYSEQFWWVTNMTCGTDVNGTVSKTEFLAIIISIYRQLIWRKNKGKIAGNCQEVRKQLFHPMVFWHTRAKLQSPST